jgi:hypothetical protein
MRKPTIPDDPWTTGSNGNDAAEAAQREKEAWMADSSVRS